MSILEEDKDILFSKITFYAGIKLFLQFTTYYPNP